MNAESFVKYLDQLAMLYQLPYEELKSLCLEYPYFQNLHLMLALKSKLEDHPDFERNLARASTYSQDRPWLFRSLNQLEKIALEENFALEEEVLELQEISKVQQKLETLEVRPAEDHQAPESPPAITYPEFSSEPDPEPSFVPDFSRPSSPPPPSSAQTVEAKEPLKKPSREIFQEATETAMATARCVERYQRQRDIRRRFLQRLRKLESAINRKLEQKKRNRPLPKKSFTSWVEQFQPDHVRPRLGELMEAKHPAQQANPAARKAEEPSLTGSNLTFFARKSVRDNEQLASETLAELLVAQLQYQKAIQVYQRLSLIFPEKSAFFAEKIKNLKKLIS